MKAIVVCLFLISLVIVSASKPIPPPKSDCDICETLILAIEGWMNENKTVTQIEADVDTICALVPAFEQVCDAFANQGIVNIIQWIDNNESPATVCSQLGLCGMKKPIQPKVMVGVRDTNCFMCETLVQAIEGWLNDSATVQQIEQSLEQLCALIPGFQATCDAIVEQGVPQIIQWLEQNESPQQICVQLGMCTSKPKPKVMVSKPKLLMLSMPKRPGDANCVICESIIEAVEDWVQNNSTVQEIEQNLEILCALIPGFQQQCDAIIETEVPTIIQWLQQNENPQTICTQLGFCTSVRRLLALRKP